MGIEAEDEDGKMKMELKMKMKIKMKLMLNLLLMLMLEQELERGEMKLKLKSSTELLTAHALHLISFFSDPTGEHWRDQGAQHHDAHASLCGEVRALDHGTRVAAKFLLTRCLVLDEIRAGANRSRCREGAASQNDQSQQVDLSVHEFAVCLPRLRLQFELRTRRPPQEGRAHGVTDSASDRGRRCGTGP